MTLDLEPEKLSKGFAKVNKTISQISPSAANTVQWGRNNLNSDSNNDKEKAKEFKATIPILSLY